MTKGNDGLRNLTLCEYVASKITSSVYFDDDVDVDAAEVIRRCSKEKLVPCGRRPVSSIWSFYRILAEKWLIESKNEGVRWKYRFGFWIMCIRKMTTEFWSYRNGSTSKLMRKKVPRNMYRCDNSANSIDEIDFTKITNTYNSY